MKLINRLVLLLVGVALTAAGAAVVARGLGRWGNDKGPILPHDIVLVLEANPWARRLVAAIAASVAVSALWLLLANLTPRSRILKVARHCTGNTVIRTASLLDAVRDDARHYAKLSQVRASMAGRPGRPRLNLWLTINSTDSPQHVLETLTDTIAPRLRRASGDDAFPVSAQLRFAPKAAHPERKGRASVA
jgi:hypothetical protein